MDVDTIASVATAIGVAVAVCQFRESVKLSRSEFEDSLDQQYRELSFQIPVDVILSGSMKDIDTRDLRHARESIYNYLDLCNEQVYLRSKNRVTAARWKEWNSGIEQNLQRAYFATIWKEVKRKAPGAFSYLEALEVSDFKKDPIENRFDVFGLFKTR
ncbi:hypothetical protein [uncultured Umboniibacter sp.]|uniref:hypothetical protein n=1 Tax=uncultured Umboniibacter sp. TaxID=1798917 RepID=UPI00261EB399|nr:hypothetical protein [uncultured Umboniibacter sp.]